MYPVWLLVGGSFVLFVLLSRGSRSLFGLALYACLGLALLNLFTDAFGGMPIIFLTSMVSLIAVAGTRLALEALIPDTEVPERSGTGPSSGGFFPGHNDRPSIGERVERAVDRHTEIRRQQLEQQNNRRRQPEPANNNADPEELWPPESAFTTDLEAIDDHRL